jgi:ribosomal protein L24E
MNNSVYKLLDWIDINKLCWKGLSRNPNAIDLLKQNLDKIDIIELFDNPNILDIIHLIDTTLLENCLNRFSKSGSNLLFTNINVIKLLNKYSLAIDWTSLSLNTNTKAIELLKKNPKKINWRLLCYNSNDEAIELLKDNPKKINWSNLSRNINTKAIKLLKQNPKKIDWYNLSQNPNQEALKLLKENPKKISWSNLLINPNPEAIDLLKTNPDCEALLYDDLASNVSDKAIELLIENIDELTDFGWITLSYNTNSKAIQLLKNNLDKLKNNYIVLSYNENPDIMELLKENQHLIYWHGLSDNSNIFKLDYEQMKKNFEPLAKEIIEAACYPNRIRRIMKQYNFDFEDWF